MTTILRLLDSDNKPGFIEQELDFDHELSDAYNFFEDIPLTEEDNIVDETNLNEETEKSRRFFISSKIQKIKKEEKEKLLKIYKEDGDGISGFLKNGLHMLSKRNQEVTIAFNYPRTFLTIKEKTNFATLDPVIERVIKIKSIPTSDFNGVTPKIVSISTKNPISPDRITKSSFYLFPSSSSSLPSNNNTKNENTFVIENLVTGNGNLVTTPNKYKFNVDVCALFLTEYFSRNVIEPNLIGNKILQKFYEDYHGVYNAFFHNQMNGDFHIIYPSDKEQLKLNRLPVPLNNQQFDKFFDE